MTTVHLCWIHSCQAGMTRKQFAEKMIVGGTCKRCGNGPIVAPCPVSLPVPKIHVLPAR